MSSAVAIANISKKYQLYDNSRQRLKELLLGWTGRQYHTEFKALEKVSLEVAPGECYGILGRNGSGKSTLLQIIAGTLTPSGGRVEVNGRLAALLELGAGFMPDYTGRENVLLNGAVLGLRPREIRERLDEIIAFADIGEFIDQPVRVYSSGMYVRLAFAVNACVRPDVLIIDEALAVGDAPFQAKCFKYLRGLLKDGTAIVFVSHDIATVRGICDRALWLDQGAVKACGEAREVAREYEKFCWSLGGGAIGTPEEQKQNGEAARPEHASLTAAARKKPGGRVAITRRPLAEKTIFEEPCSQRRDSVNYSKPADMPSHLREMLLTDNSQFARFAAPNRFGTGEVRIANLILTDLDDEPIDGAFYDQMIVANYYISVAEDVDSDFRIGIRFKDAMGNHIIAFEDLNALYHLKAEAGVSFFLRVFFRVPLTHQKYYFQTAIFGSSDGNLFAGDRYDFSKIRNWDALDMAAILEVHSYEHMALPGPVEMHSAMRVVSNED